MRNYNEIAGQVGGGESLDRAHDVAVDGAGRVHVVGGLDVEWGGVSYDQTYGILTYANDGTLLNVQYFDNSPAFPLDDEALAVAVTQAGDVAVTGAAFGDSTLEDIGTVAFYANDLIFADGFENGSLSEWSTFLFVE